MFVAHKGWCLVVAATPACDYMPCCSVPMGTGEMEHGWKKLRPGRKHGERNEKYYEPQVR